MSHIVGLALTGLLFGLAAAAAAGPEGQPPVVRDKVPGKLQGFNYGEVQLLPGPLKDAFETNRRYLLTLSPDRYLWTFRMNAGLPTPDQPYGGWEKPDGELRGHSIGHYLSACARTIAQTGDAQLKRNADYTVAELARCQAKLGKGYLSAYPESFFDRVEASQPVWAPYYTMHKIMLGLWEMHRYAGNPQALDVLRGMADYFKGRCDKLDDAHMQRMLGNEFGGMQEVLLNLYSSTGDPKYLDLAMRFEHKPFFEPLRDGKDVLPGRHANTHIPKIAGAARAYELTGDDAQRKAVAFFWDVVATTQSYATGGSNVNEHWVQPNKLAATLADNNQEFCTSYNWQKISRYLLRWSGDCRYADIIERVFYNGILVSQHPQTGMLIYFLPLKTGSHKTFGNPFDTFTCCYGTGIQQYASLGEDVFFHTDDALYVNLFANAAVTWKSPAGDVKLSQQTNYPAEASTRLAIAVAKPAEIKLVVRVPWWASSGVQVKVNGQPWQGAQPAKPGSWLTIDRKWADGDAVEMTMPMSLHAQPINDAPTLAAVMYGPLVMAGLLDPAYQQPGHLAPVFTGDMSDPGKWIEPVAGKPLTFRTKGQPADVTFIPIHNVVDETYGVYWRFAKPGSPQLAAYEKTLAALRDRERRTVDSVAIGNPESEKAHDLQGQNTQSGPFPAGTWRHAGKGGFFSYKLKVDPGQDNVVAVTYWGGDTGARVFDILVDGTRIATQTLNKNAPGQLFTVEYPIPRKLTEGKQDVVIRFEPAPNSDTAGGVFGLAVLRAEAPPATR